MFVAYVDFAVVFALTLVDKSPVVSLSSPQAERNIVSRQSAATLLMPARDISPP